MSPGSLSTTKSPNGKILNGRLHALATRLLTRMSLKTSCNAGVFSEGGKRELQETRSWLLHHHNATAHNTLGNPGILPKILCFAGATTLLSRAGHLQLLFVSQAQESH